MDNQLLNPLDFQKFDLKERYVLYFLIHKDSVVYVGKTHYLESRLLAHKKDKVFDCYSFIECRNDLELDLLEFQYILFLNPKYNLRLTYVPNEYASKSQAKQILKDRGIASKVLKGMDKAFSFKDIDYYFLKDINLCILQYSKSLH